MNQATFKRRLVDFFERHDSANLGLVDPIVDKFQGREEDVFRTLNEFYVNKPSGVHRDEVMESLSTSTPILGDNAPSSLDNLSSMN